MKAIVVSAPGPESELEIQDVPQPKPGPGHVLVRIVATALNRADLLQRAGHYPPPPGASEILGLEMAGVIESRGPDCSGTFATGDRVMALLPGGGYAAYAVVPEALLMRIPERLSFTEAAAIPEVFLTAFQAVYWLGELKSDETVLLHAGGSGVSTAAIQLAVHQGSAVFVTASEAKHNACKALGAAAAIDYKTAAFEDVISELTDKRGVDLIVDYIGAPYFAANIASLATDGRLVVLAMMGGSKVSAVNLMQLFRKRIHVKTSTLRSRSAPYKAALTAAFVEKFGDALIAGDINPVIDGVYNWQDAEAAHARMRGNLNTGKIVLSVSESA
ncbi:MAG: NAD(P)H-quinone oxidoreductase [Bacteroidota bacterium]